MSENRNKVDIGDNANLRDTIGGDKNEKIEEKYVIHGDKNEKIKEKYVIHGDKNEEIKEKNVFHLPERTSPFEKITSRKLITTSPYKSLNAFQSRDKDLFFGRDNFINTLVDKLESTNLVLLLGASGSGKSSVVRAGLIPWLAKEYGTRFTNLTFTPDADPFESFYASLLSNNYSQKPAKIAREGQAETLIQVVKNLKQRNEFWFIFIDQFEELFTISDKNKSHEFITGLMQLSQAKLPNIKIMATMRTDFQDRLSDYPQLVEATQKNRQMQPNELRIAIEQPAAHHGVVFEAGLVDKIIAEIQGQAGCLPLLQYTLNLLWDEVKTGTIDDDRTLSINTYQELGGVTGALQQHVNNIYKSLSEPEQQVTRRIFLRLVEIGKNAAAGIEWKPVRRRAQLSEFGEDERDLLLKLVNQNLLVSDADSSGADLSRKSKKSQATIEITHEILLTSWDKLHRWIKENRQGIALRNRLYEDVKRWQAKKPEDELWAGSKLEEVLELKEKDDFKEVLGEFNDEAIKFIRASKDKKNRQLRRARRTAAIGFILAGLATMAGGFAFVQQQSAQKRSIIGMTQTAEAHLSVNNQLDAMVEAIRAKKELEKVGIGKDVVSMRVLTALGQAVHHHQQGWKERLRLRGTNVMFSANGKLLATRDNKFVRVWDTSTGEELQTPKGHQDWINSAVFSADDRQLMIESTSGTARVQDVTTGEVLHTLKGHEDKVESVAFSPDGQYLATGSTDGTARVWDATTGELLHTLKGHEDEVESVAFSRDGQLATGSTDGTARVWDATTGELLQILKGDENGVESVAFSRDSQYLATGSRDGTARVWNATTGEPLQILKGHKHWVYGVAFSRDGQYLATGSRDGTARLWIRAGAIQHLPILQGHEDWINSVAFSADGQQLATASLDKTARVWNATTGELLHTLKGHEDEVESVTFSPDGQYLATASEDGTARVWDATTGRLLQTFGKYKSGVESVTFSPDGQYLATASEDKAARVWNATTGELLQILKGHEDEVESVAFSPDGQQLATASEDGTARVWNATTGEPLQILKGHEDLINSVAFSRDGKVATASFDNTARVWNATTGELLHTLKGHEAEVESVAFSPDGQQLATASKDGTARVWDATTGEPLQILKGHKNEVKSVAFSPDGKRVATVSLDNTARVWRLGDIEDMLAISCDWVRHYLATNPNLEESDRTLCDDIPSPEVDKIETTTKADFAP